jgi:hypothetical protein
MSRPTEAAPALIYKEGEDVVLDGEVFDPETGENAAAWGSIVGTLADQTDLQTALDDKAELTADELAAIQGAAAPDAENVFATIADLPSDTGGTFEAAANSPADGVDDEFTFTGTPVCVFRNGVNETRLGTIAGSAFTFDSAPADGDDIEAIL